MKTKFRPSTAPDKTEPVMYQLIHEQITGKIRDGHDCPIRSCPADQDRIGTVLGYNLRHEQLASIRLNVEQELQRLKRLANELDKAVEHRQKSVNGTKKSDLQTTAPSVFNFIRAQIRHKDRLGKVRSCETYQATLNSFMRFRKGMDLTFDMIDSELMESYEAEMASRGLSRNTSSFYMRILRTNYRQAVEKGLSVPPHVKTSLAPGSHNRFQQLYCLPAALAAAPSALFVETKTKDVVIPFAAPLPIHLSTTPVDPVTPTDPGTGESGTTGDNSGTAGGDEMPEWLRP